MPTLPPLIELRAFEAAARHLSFKAAATELGVTPTAISHQIRLLEQYCGQPLFRRRPRPLALTWAGERLFPVLRDGFIEFADALALLRGGSASGGLRVTATNAFAARWLVPRLARWRASHPHLHLDIVGTDNVLDLQAGEADIAIRYARKPPLDSISTPLASDRFHVVASPGLVGKKRLVLTPSDLARFPLIEAEWPPSDPQAPNWRSWEHAARLRHGTIPALAGRASLSFREELHAIEAAVSGQGIAICSDVLVAPELRSGALVPVSDITLPGYTFFLAYRKRALKLSAIRAFVDWATKAV